MSPVGCGPVRAVRCGRGASTPAQPLSMLAGSVLSSAVCKNGVCTSRVARRLLKESVRSEADQLSTFQRGVLRVSSSITLPYPLQHITTNRMSPSTPSILTYPRRYGRSETGHADIGVTLVGRVDGRERGERTGREWVRMVAGAVGAGVVVDKQWDINEQRRRGGEAVQAKQWGAVSTRVSIPTSKGYLSGDSRTVTDAW